MINAIMYKEKSNIYNRCQNTNYLQLGFNERSNFVQFISSKSWHYSSIFFWIYKQKSILVVEFEALKIIRREMSFCKLRRGNEQFFAFHFEFAFREDDS